MAHQSQSRDFGPEANQCHTQLFVNDSGVCTMKGTHEDDDGDTWIRSDTVVSF